MRREIGRKKAIEVKRSAHCRGCFLVRRSCNLAEMARKFALCLWIPPIDTEGRAVSISETTGQTTGNVAALRYSAGSASIQFRIYWNNFGSVPQCGLLFRRTIYRAAQVTLI